MNYAAVKILIAIPSGVKSCPPPVSSFTLVNFPAVCGDSAFLYHLVDLLLELSARMLRSDGVVLQVCMSRSR